VVAVVGQTATLAVLVEMAVVVTVTTAQLAIQARLEQSILVVVAVRTAIVVVVVLSLLTLDKSQHLLLVHRLCQAQNILLLLVERLLSDV
jgi:hypothetical protein